jgi:hypothetical protein
MSVALVMALFPTIKGFLTASAGNMTAGEVALTALIPLVLVIALVVNVGRQLGIIKGKK